MRASWLAELSGSTEPTAAIAGKKHGAATRRATPGTTFPGPRLSPGCGRTSSPGTRSCTAPLAAWPAWRLTPSSCPAPADWLTSARPGTAASPETRTSWPPRATGLGLKAGDLDDLVREAYSRQASEVNNGGLHPRVRFLIESCGTGHARSLLSDLRPAPAQRASAPGAAASAVGAEPVPAVGSRPVAPAASPAVRPGRPRPVRRAARPPFHAGGGRVKPTTGDSPPLDSGSP